MNDKKKIIKTHIGIYGVIEKNDELLVIKKSRGPYIGLFDLPGGRPMPGEPISETLKREIQEETGLIEIIYSLRSNFDILVPYKNLEIGCSFLHHFAMIYNIEDANFNFFNPSINAEDVNKVLWMNKKDLDRKNNSPLLNHILGVN